MAKTYMIPVTSIRFNPGMVIKLWSSVKQVLDGEKAQKIVSKMFGNIASDMVIISIADHLKRLDKSELEELRDNLKDMNSIKEAKMAEKCLKCGKDVIGAARFVESKERFEHIICPAPGKEQEEKENDMGKKKEGKTKKAVEKKAARQAGAKKEPKPKDDMPKISAIAYDCIKAKMTYEQAEKAVKKVHPESKFNKKHYAWYANQYEKIKK